MTEWHLQKCLTERWLADGGRVEMGGERFVLAAWEVMSRDWRINEARRPPWSPSIDFVLADQAGQLAALELKTAVHGVLGAWELLCQVSHRAAVLTSTYTPARFTSAYEYCMSGADGRITPPRAVRPLPELIAGVFGQPEAPLPETVLPLRRFVMAKGYNRDWSGCSSTFANNGEDAARIMASYLARTRRPTEIRRWNDLDDLDRARVSARGAIVAVDVHGQLVPPYDYTLTRARRDGFDVQSLADRDPNSTVHIDDAAQPIGVNATRPKSAISSRSSVVSGRADVRRSTATLSTTPPR